MIIKRGDAKILAIIPEEDLNETQKIATKVIAKNNKKTAVVKAPAPKAEDKKN